jgi:copper chaperone CopZ
MTPTSPSLSTQYIVEGMTCDHCTASVTEEVSAVAGVQRIAVDLPTGRLTVVGDVSASAVRAAVDEAGYRVAS